MFAKPEKGSALPGVIHIHVTCNDYYTVNVIAVVLYIYMYISYVL